VVFLLGSGCTGPRRKAGVTVVDWGKRNQKIADKCPGIGFRANG